MNTRAKYRQRLKQGDVLIHQGDKGDELYVLEKGRLEVFIEGRMVGVIDAAVSQEFVGEVAALLGELRTATVVAATDCLVLSIPKMEIEDVLIKMPSLGAKLARSLCRKLSQGARSYMFLKSGEEMIQRSGSVDISLRNYMKGLLAFMEEVEKQSGAPMAGELCQYFRETNPWGIQKGEARYVMDVPK